MKLFTITEEGKLIPYEENRFKDSNHEEDLEILLENNPEYFFQDTDVLIIGRQVTTNLNTFIDLIGIDKYGNSVVIELKRGKTPRETIAQLLEYASFIENLDYSQLNEIYQDYSGDETELEDYHKHYFQETLDENVAFNKATRLIIVAETISKEIRQTAMFLRKKGIDIYCMEFKYFQTKSGERIITSDFTVGEEEFIRQKLQSASLPKVDQEQFLKSLDEFGQTVFERILQFSKKNNLLIRWGSKGFSLNVELENGFVGLLFGYPPNSVFKQTVYTGFEEIRKKVNNSEEVIEFYKMRLENIGYFIKAKSNYKWLLDKNYSEEEITDFLLIIRKLILKIRERGMK